VNEAFLKGAVNGLFIVFNEDFRACLLNGDENVTFFNKKAVLLRLIHKKIANLQYE